MEPDVIQRQFPDKYKEYLRKGDTSGLTQKEINEIEAKLDDTKKFYNLKALHCQFVGVAYRGYRVYTFKGIRK